MKFNLILFSVVLFLFSVSKIQAVENIYTTPNNRFGIHIIDENDIEKAAELVNSSGGDWGYVTLVIREDDRNIEKWQRIFNKMRRLHLIPLVRLATVGEGSNWRAPKPENAQAWVDFLNSLNWVIKNRYVILFNEPNHAKEWGGEVKPNEFAAVIKSFSETLKKSSSDFVILPGAVDSASTDSQDTMSAKQFYKWMHSENPEIFKLYDGLVSHSYPHPEFVGKVTSQGPGTITAYRWEQEFLKNIGLKSNLPIFITETGWAHNGGQRRFFPALSPEKVSQNYEVAFTKIWTDPQIMAITPFILNYQDTPFEQFSWLKAGGTDTFPQFDQVKSLPKISGRPEQEITATIDPGNLPEKLVISSQYHLPIKITNTGQNIWNKESNSLVIKSPLVENGKVTITLPQTEPGDVADLNIILITPEKVGSYPLTISLRNLDKEIKVRDIPIKVVNPPSLYVKAQVWIKRQSTGDDFTLLIYDDGNLVKKISPFKLENGVGQIKGLTDVIPNRFYRFVITKPFFLPRQKMEYLSETITHVTFDRLLPVDLYPDGKFNLRDIFSALKHPILSFSLWRS